MTKPTFPEDLRRHLDFRLRDSNGKILTDDLQIHLLQLSNLKVTAQNVSMADSIEQWAYFLLNLHKMTMEEVRRLFPADEFTEAAGVLEMISQNPEQRQQYDARHRDEAARLEFARIEAREEGLKEGLEKGELIGQVKLPRELAGIPAPTLTNFLA